MVMAIGVYAFVRTHQIVYLRSDYFTIYKFYLKNKIKQKKNQISHKSQTPQEKSKGQWQTGKQTTALIYEVS